MATDQEVEAAIRKTIRLEGGGKFTDNPRDKGGPTKFGITLRTLQRLQPGATRQDVKALTRQDAEFIYKRAFAPDIRRLVPAELFPQVFDIAVNSGPDRAIRILQRAVGAKDDGKIGPETFKRIEEAFAVVGPERVNADIADERELFVADAVLSGGIDPTFEQGLINRAREFKPKRRP